MACYVRRQYSSVVLTLELSRRARARTVTDNHFAGFVHGRLQRAVGPARRRRDGPLQRRVGRSTIPKLRHDDATSCEQNALASTENKTRRDRRAALTADQNRRDELAKCQCR